MDCSPPGSSVHGILQERILEWVAISQCYQLEYLLQDRDFMRIFKKHIGNPFVVQWLGLRALTARTQVHSLVRELRSCKPRGIALFI